jgi:hypothetical protein
MKSDANHRATRALEAVLSKLEPERKAATAAWLALTLADALPKDESFPPFLAAFTSMFISQVLGEDPAGDPDRIRAAIGRFAAAHPPDPGAGRCLLQLLRESIDGGDPVAFTAGAMHAIGAAFVPPAPARSPAKLSASPLAVRFGLKPATNPEKQLAKK